MKGQRDVRRSSNSGVEPICIECGSRGVLTPGSILYARRPDLPAARLNYYVCACGARVGCHPGSAVPVGLPCRAETSRARDRLHRIFDPIWRARVAAGVQQRTARERAYIWLARKLGIPKDDCHIGRFDLATCERAIEIVEAIRPPKDGAGPRPKRA